MSWKTVFTFITAALLVLTITGSSGAQFDSPLPTPTAPPTVEPTPVITPTPDPGYEVPLPTGATPLEQLLAELIGGGLSAVVVFWFLDTPAGDGIVRLISPVLKSAFGFAKSSTKRLVAIILSTTISVAAYAVAAVFGYVPLPVDVQGWFNLILVLEGLAFTGSQMLHMQTLNAGEWYEDRLRSLVETVLRNHRDGPTG